MKGRCQQYVIASLMTAVARGRLHQRWSWLCDGGLLCEVHVLAGFTLILGGGRQSVAHMLAMPTEIEDMPVLGGDCCCLVDYL